MGVTKALFLSLHGRRKAVDTLLQQHDLNFLNFTWPLKGRQ
jgi:hypothetical protein